LLQIEEVTVGTNSGRAPLLKQYYNFWENKILQALLKLVLRASADLATLVGMVKGKQGRPLIRLYARANPDVVISPTVVELQKRLMKILKTLIESTTKSFYRWKNGSCIICPPQIVAGHEEPIVFSFYDDIQSHASCLKAMLAFHTYLSKTAAKIEKTFAKYKRYSSLWETPDERRVIVEKWLKGNLRGVVEFDEKLKHYRNIVRDCDSMPATMMIDFVNVSTSALHLDIKTEAQAWMSTICSFLRDNAKAALDSELLRVSNLRDELQKNPETIDDFKALLQKISDTVEHSADIDATRVDIQERYSLLKYYEYSESLEAEEFAAAGNLCSDWIAAVGECKAKSLEVAKIKRQFASTTAKDELDFLGESDTFWQRVTNEGPASPELQLDNLVEQCTAYTQELKVLVQRKEAIASAMKLFGLEPATYTSLIKAQDCLNSIKDIASLYADFRESTRVWSGTLFFTGLNMETLLSGVAAYTQRHKKLPKTCQRYLSYERVGKAVDAFQASLPLIGELKSDAMRPRHWARLLPSKEINPNTFTLEELFALNLGAVSDLVTEIVTQAGKEVAIEKGLDETENTWRNQSLDMYRYLRDGKDRGYCLKATEEVTLLLDDNLMNLNSMGASKFVGPFIDNVRGWEKKLSLIGEVLEAWLQVQRKWQYLESIFEGEDIKQQLPAASKKFEKIDQTWSKLMSESYKDKNVLRACCVEGRLDVLKNMALELDACQKSLSDFLDSKRNSFARFFFISDDEMLSILGSSDVTAVQEHCLKMFDNCKNLIFARQNKVVVGMLSSENEILNFKTAVAAEGPVETWMTAVLAEMRASLHVIMKESVFHYPKMNRIRWIDANLGMSVNGGSQLWWTWQVEDGFRRVQQAGEKHAIKNLNALLSSQLNDLVAELRKELSSQQRKKINTLVIIDVHSRDIVDSFVRDSILDEREFAWESQLRYYWVRSEDDVRVRQCTFVTAFGYEYMGLNGRLVITPLTDRCYMTLTQALSFRLGGI
jgi:dynein heavy chain, axonemal